MTSKRPALTSEDIGKLIALGAVLLGAFLALYPPWLAGFPINDGGLFYTMIRAIQQSGFRLPDQISYNGLSIPFAYPPLALYLAAGLSSAAQLDPITLLQWMPAIVLIPISIVFYLLARRLLDSPIAAGVATFVYVCTPRSMTWLVMGGGLTRGLGHLFLLLTVLAVHDLYTRRQRKHLLLSIVWGTLVVLTHPEAALQAIGAILLLWMFFGRSRQSTLDSVLLAAGVAIASAAWWLPTILRHGLSPFLSAGGTGWELSAKLIAPLLLTFSEEPMMTVLPVLAIIGLAASVGSRQWLLPAWFVLPFILDPRGAATVAVVPGAMLAALALDKVVIPGLYRLSSKKQQPKPGSAYADAPALIVVCFLSVYMLIMALYAAMELSRVVLTRPDREALAWVAANTPAAGRFLVLTGETELFCDPLQEWFPVLTQRVSVATLQGHEWDRLGSFTERMAQSQSLQRCARSSDPVVCLSDGTRIAGYNADYVFIPKQGVNKKLCRAQTGERSYSALIDLLGADGRFRLTFESPSASVFAVGEMASDPID